VNWLADYNPFYFLSACCMLLGIFVLNNSLTWSPLPQHNLLVLIATLNVYELALVGLAIVLMRRGLMRDGMFLLLLEAFFMADAGFLNMEVFTTDPVTGLIVNGILFGLAVVKVAFVFAATGLPVRSGAFAFVIAQLALLFAIPGVFSDLASHRQGVLPMLAVTGAWWAAGLVPVLYVAARSPAHAHAGCAACGEGVRRAAVRVAAGAPVPCKLGVQSAVSPEQRGADAARAGRVGRAIRLARLDAGVADADAAGAAVRGSCVVGDLAGRESAGIAARVRVPSASGSRRCGWRCCGASAVYLDGWILHRHAYFAAGSVLCLAGAGLGSSMREMNRNTIDFANYWLDGIRALVPTTSSQWGVLSVIGAFVLLGMGAALSLLREPPSEDGNESRSG
jgi:hypothetical protein